MLPKISQKSFDGFFNGPMELTMCMGNLVFVFFLDVIGEVASIGFLLPDALHSASQPTTTMDGYETSELPLVSLPKDSNLPCPLSTIYLLGDGR